MSGQQSGIAHEPRGDPNGMDKKVRIVVADDHLVVREGLVAILSSQPDMEVVGTASDGAQTVSVWQEQRPDILLLDLRMPVMSGVDVIHAIRRLDRQAMIVILTVYETDEDIYRGIQAGASAYLLKDAPLEELLDCINTVAHGESYVPPAIADKLVRRMRHDILTSRELEVLALIAQGNSNKVIAKSLGIGEGTIKSHVNSILQKLDATSRLEAIVTAARRGLISL